MKWSEGLSNRVSIIIRRYRSYEACCLNDCFFCHIRSYSFSYILYHCIYGYMFCMPPFNLVNYVFLLLCLCILIVMYAPFWVFCFIVLFCVLFVCKCVPYYCCRVSTPFQLTNTLYQAGVPFVLTLSKLTISSNCVLSSFT